MSLSNITTSMLNSMGLENKTLVYFIIGGVIMLFCIWFLPSVCGIYSLLVGFSAIYGLTTLLNLILLNKNCKEKPRYLKFIFCAGALLIPTLLFGFMLEKILVRSLGSFLTLLVCGSAMMVFNALLYFGFNLLSAKLIFSKLKLNLKKKKTAVR